jgi:eukaryotic-like serine/threonine-protein kinase
VTSAIPGSRIDQVQSALGAEYEVIRLLGAGGMAAVYLARERALKRLVAIKVLDPDLAASPLFRARFQREAEMAAQLQHANIVPIYRVGETGGVSFFTMAYVEGESLADRLKREHQLPLAESLRIGREIAAALGAAHRRGIVHRDVKPANVLLERESGRVLVTDFGIARAGMAEENTGGEDLTGVGMVMGTPRYMSPEQAAGTRDLTPASDLYALGLILYESIAGAYPYKVGQPPNFLVAHLTRQPIPLVARVGDVPRSVENAVNRLLAKDPSERFDTAEAVIGQLVEGDPSGERPRLRRRGRRRWLTALPLLAVAAGAWILGRGHGLSFGGRNAVPKGVDPRQSILIGFFQNTTLQPKLDWLRVGGVELLAQSLSRWQDLQVVDAERLLDLARGAHIADGAQLSQEDAIRLARNAGVWTVALGSILPRGADSVALTVRVYDVASSRQLTTATASAAAAGDLTDAFNALAGQILQIGGGRGEPLAVEPPTHSIEAYRAYIEGIEARSQWEIPRAEAAFALAIERDSSFALAYYELSQLVLDKEWLTDSVRFINLADHAYRDASTRPPREQLLIEAYYDLVHARFSESKRKYRELLQRDSTLADAWAGLGTAEQLDVTLRKDARGREYLPASYTSALQAYERALSLAATDHRNYANLSGLLGMVSLDRQNQVYGYGDPPPGPINTIYYRVPKRTYIPLLVGDSIALVPSESLSVRYPPRLVDSLRARARTRALEVTQRWLDIAPNEGFAHLFMADLQRAEGHYDAALTRLSEAEALGVSTAVPLSLYRLALLLEAQRLGDVTAFADSIMTHPALRDSLTIGPAVLAAAPLANALLVAGRVGDAQAIGQQRLAASSARDLPAQSRRLQALAVAAAPLAFRTAAGRTTADQLRSVAAELTRLIAAAPDSERASLRTFASGSVTFAAASLGDTATVRTWASQRGTPVRPGLAAWAAAAAGDRLTANRLLTAAISDTGHTPKNVWAMARAAQLVGRTSDAMKLYAELDTVRYSTVENINSDWLLRVRSLAARGGLYEAAGDTARARAAYRGVLDLWKTPDPMIRDEAASVARALAELDRGDRGDVRK